MKNKFFLGYGIFAFIILISSFVWFIYSISSEAKKGAIEAERSFSWISREVVSSAITEGFLSESYIQKITDVFKKSQLLSAVVITSPSGAVLAWPQKSSSIRYTIDGKPEISSTSMFMKVFSSNLDIGDGKTGLIGITAELYILQSDTIFAASRISFLVILALLFITLILILIETPTHKKTKTYVTDISEIQLESTHSADSSVLDSKSSTDVHVSENTSNQYTPDNTSTTEVSDFDASHHEHNGPEGLFSPITGIGWEPYLVDRLDAELVRAASSEQDLSLIIIRVSNLLHSDLLSKKISLVLLDTFKFRDLIFEYNSDGFAGILQNINLDQAMKIADSLYAEIDSILMDESYEGRITIGITTRTARLLPASRLIEEAASAAQKAVEEPSLPIVAFRANPEKYRNFVVENS